MAQKNYSLSNVLVVDDDALLRTLLVNEFQKAGIRALSAPNGAEAVIVMEKVSMDVVITGLHMPIMDGFSLIRHIRIGETVNPTIIIALSLSDDEEIHGMALRVGADEFIQKPVTPSFVRGIVGSYLLAHKRGRESELFTGL